MKTRTAQAGMNGVACPLAPKQYGGCPGTLFVPITLQRLAELRKGDVLVVKERANCGHVVEVTFKG